MASRRTRPEKLNAFTGKVQEYLRGQLLRRIVTVLGDRYPHVIPVAVASDGEMLYSNVQYDSKKARNVRGNLRVSFVVDDFGHTHSEVTEKIEVTHGESFRL